MFSSFTSPCPEAVKKLLRVERVGRDIRKVFQWYLFTLTLYDEKFQSPLAIEECCCLRLPNDRICKTLRYSRPTKGSQFFYTFLLSRGERRGEGIQ
jgi:hypothetical protein